MTIPILNYQIIVNYLVALLTVSIPIAIIITLGEKLVDIFLEFVRGDKKVQL